MLIMMKKLAGIHLDILRLHNKRSLVGWTPPTNQSYGTAEVKHRPSIFTMANYQINFIKGVSFLRPHR